jgi:hypothetical protein
MFEFLMKIAKKINYILNKFDILLIRKSTFDKILDNSISDPDSAIFEKKIDDALRDLIRHQISIKWDLVDQIEKANSAAEKAEMICPLCNYSGIYEQFSVFMSQCIFGGGQLKRFQCPKCDVIFGANKMLVLNAKELSQDYESHYKVYQEGDTTNTEIRAFYLLKPKKSGIYLNYGAGALLKSVQILRSQGWNVFAYEPCSHATCEHDYLIRNKVDLIKFKFDGIFSNNVLEHIRQPIEEFEFMKSILKPKSKMSHATPCYEYLYEFTRFHLFFYLGRSKNLLAKKTGLVISDFLVDNEFMCAVYEKQN